MQLLKILFHIFTLNIYLITTFPSVELDLLKSSFHRVVEITAYTSLYLYGSLSIGMNI
jgi:hypothetical protein